MWRSVFWTVLIGLTALPIFADDEENFRSQIFVGNADGSNLKRLVDLPDYQSQGSPNWSGDGKLIAFDAWKSQKGERFFNGHVFVANPDGTNVRDLGPGSTPSLSPRGYRVAYSRDGRGGSTGIWIKDVEDPETTSQIDTAGWGPDWSPDGTRVAYARGNNLMMFSMVEGTVEPILDEAPARFNSVFGNFCWSPDSRKIAFKAITKENNTVVAVVDARGESYGLKILYEGETWPGLSWNPIRDEIVVTIDDPKPADFSRLFTINVEKPEQPKLLPQLPENRKLSDPCISPDGKRLAVSGFKRQIPPTGK